MSIFKRFLTGVVVGMEDDVLVHVCVCVCVCVVNYTAGQAIKAQSSPLPN